MKIMTVGLNKNLPIVPSRTSQNFYPLFLPNNHLLLFFNFTGSVTLMSKMLTKVLETELPMSKD